MTTPRRVLHLLPDLARGGGQSVVLELVRHADRAHFHISVAALHDPDDLVPELEAEGAAPTIVGGSRRRSAAALRRMLRSERIELLHVHSGEDRIVGQIAAAATGTPVVGHLHSPWDHLQPMCDPTAPPPVRAWSVAKAAMRRNLEAKTVRRYVSAGVEITTFHEHRVHAPVATIPNGVDTVRFAPASRAERSRRRASLGIEPDATVLVCVGRLAGGKGQDELIRAMVELPGHRLLLIGDGEDRPSLEDLAGALGVGDRVAFLGDRQDVADLLGVADLFVFASISEGLPMAVLEAMATELPVVAYDLPAFRSLIVGEDNGVLVPLGARAELVAAIAEVTDDEVRLRRMGAAARSTVLAGFDAARMTRQVEEVYAEVLAAPRVPTRSEHLRVGA